MRFLVAFLAFVSPVVALRLGGRALGSGRRQVWWMAPGRVRVRYAADDDLGECRERRAWLADVAARGGRQRVTLSERDCLERGDEACEYTVTWTRRRPDAFACGAAALAGLSAAACASHFGGSALGASLAALPVLIGGQYVADRRDRAGAARARAGLRHLLPHLRPLEPPPSAGAALALEREGELWRITFETTTIRLRHSRGLALLAHLVRAPGREIHVRELDAITPSGGRATTREAGGLPSDVVETSAVVADEPLDAAARTAYRHRVAELERELEEAESAHDLGSLERLRHERELLVAELSAVERAGRGRRRAPVEVERIRLAVSRRIRAAIVQIEKQDARIGAHLAVSVTTGYACAYRPGGR